MEKDRSSFEEIPLTQEEIQLAEEATYRQLAKAQEIVGWLLTQTALEEVEVVLLKEKICIAMAEEFEVGIAMVLQLYGLKEKT